MFELIKPLFSIDESEISDKLLVLVLSDKF